MRLVLVSSFIPLCVVLNDGVVSCCIRGVLHGNDALGTPLPDLNAVNVRTLCVPALTPPYRLSLVAGDAFFLTCADRCGYVTRCLGILLRLLLPSS